MKKIYFLISLIFVSLGLNYFFYSNNIVDISTGTHFTEAFLQWPFFRIFIEPLYAFAYYILTMERSGYFFALGSWLFWSVLFVVLISKYYKVATKRIIIYSCAMFFFVASIVCFIILVPIPGPQLIVSDDYNLVDIHSHTKSSKDNISTIVSSIMFHKLSGYTDFFVTEHDNTNGYKTVPQNSNNIFPGIQIRTEGISVLLLSQEPFEYLDFQNKTIENMVKLAHEKDMLVIVPHVWKWHNKHTLQSLVDKGVDGFEIYNCGYKYIKPEERKEIVEICNKNNLMKFGTTDWHGYGYMTNVWTLIKKQDNKNLFQVLKTNPKTIVVVDDTKGWQHPIRYIFEPFFAFYYYITTVNMKYILSFYMIMSIIVLLFYRIKVIKLVKAISLFFALYYTGALLWYAYLIKFNFTFNVIIPETIIPTAFGFIVVWLAIWSACEKDI